MTGTSSRAPDRRRRIVFGRDLRTAIRRATWARDHALGLVTHLNAIGRPGEAAAATNVAGDIDAALREIPVNPPDWQPDAPRERILL